MEARFKIGNKVKILPRDHNAKYRSGYIDSMTRYSGRIATICECYRSIENPISFNDDGYNYSLDIDKQFFNWNSSMLTSLEETSSISIDKILSQHFTNNKKIYKLNWKV